jgi:hypothetical protein
MSNGTGLKHRIWSVLRVMNVRLRFVFLIWALPPFVWDSLTYHLTNVAHWIPAESRSF